MPDRLGGRLTAWTASGYALAVPHEFHAIVFDLDGVLADSEGLHVQAWERLFAARGLPFEQRWALEWVGVPDVEIAAAVARQFSAPGDGRVADRLVAGELVAEKRRLFRELVREGLQSFPGVPGEVERCVAGDLPVAVGTSSARAEATLMLEVMGLASLLPIVVAGDDVPRVKPAPDIYLEAARLLSIPSRRCIALEDSPGGIAAALAAGMAVAAVTTSFAADRLAGAARVFAAPAEAIRWLRSLVAPAPAGSASDKCPKENKVTDQETARRLEGIIPALAVPMEEGGAVDFALLERQVGYLCSHPIAGIFVGGSTGEGPYLASDEKLRIFRTVKRLAPKGVALCAACIQPATSQVVEEVRALSGEGADFVVAVTPFYLGVSQEGIVSHFRRIARESPVPLILYNIPQNTHNPMALESIVELAGVDNVAGIKDSSGDFISFSRGVLGGVPGAFAWIQGEDLLEAPSYLLGAKGVVSGLSNVAVDPYLELRQAVLSGDLEKVREGQRGIQRLFRVVQAAGGRGIPAIKAAMELLGRGSRHMRLSALTLGAADVERIRQVLAEIGLLEGAPR